MLPLFRCLRLALAASLFLVPLASLAHGADAPAAPLPDELPEKTLPAVEVTAAVPARSANQDVTVLTRAELDEAMVESLEDLVRYLPGIEVADMGRFGLNGFNIRGLEGDDVGITVDGLSMSQGVETAVNYDFFRAGPGVIDVDALKHVEIVRGADAITMGSGSLGGSVAFTTKDAEDYLMPGENDTHVSVKAGYTGQSDERLGSATLANRTGAIESLLVFTRRLAHETESHDRGSAAERQETGSGRRVPDPLDRNATAVLGKLAWLISDRQRLGLVYQGERVANHLDNLSRVEAPSYLERYGDDHNRSSRAGLRWSWQADALLFDRLDAQFDHRNASAHGVTRMLTGSGTSGTNGSTDNTTPCTLDLPCWRAEDRFDRQRTDRLAFDLGKDGAGQALVYGAAAERTRIDYEAVDTRWNNAGVLDTRTIDPAQLPATRLRHWNAWARERLSWQDERLALTLGARYDRYDYRPELGPQFVDPTDTVQALSFSAPSWQAGLQWRPVAAHSLWLQAGRGFRAPTAAELYAPTSVVELTNVATGEMVTVPDVAANPDLAAERSRNLAAGWRWRGARLLAAVSVFRDRYDDFIEQDRILHDPDVEYEGCSPWSGCSSQMGYSVLTNANIGRITIRGVEAQMRWLMSEQWQTRLAWSHNRGRRADGSPVNSVNPDQGVLGLIWQGPDRRWRVESVLTHARAKSASDVRMEAGSDAFLSPRWTTFDVLASARIGEHLDLRLGLVNLFDERYRRWGRIRNLTAGTSAVFGSISGQGLDRYDEPGRNLRLSLTWQF